jgi:8-oxo-dGTP pyrophosphatase MutT (NUDIX family)
VDRNDGSAQRAALREAEEEVGLMPSAVEVLGCLPRYLTGTMFSVTPVLGLVQPGVALRPSPDEVSDVFEVPLAFLMNPANHRWHEVEYQGALRQWLSMPYQDGEAERYIWGATAGMLRNLYAFLSA